MTATDPPTLRDLLAEIVAQGLLDVEGERTFDMRVADALLADPRIAVVALPGATTEIQYGDGVDGVVQRTVYTTAWQPVPADQTEQTTTEGNPS